MKVLHLVLCPWVHSSISQFIVYGNFNRICILLLCENCINLNYVESVHSAFQVYYILLLFCLFILLVFESLILKVLWASLVAQAVRNLPAMQETQLLFCIFILLGFESFILKLQLKFLSIFLIVIYSKTIRNFVQYFPSLL